MVERGKIIPNGVVLKAHEFATVIFFTEMGFDVELIPKSNIEGLHLPDIIMEGLRWEMKAPTGKGRWVIQNTLQSAQRQSENVIIDLRRIKLPQEKCLSALKREFEHSNKLKRMKVITKKHVLLEFTKQSL